MQKVSTAAVLPYVQCTIRPKTRADFYEALQRNVLEQKINFYSAKAYVPVYKPAYRFDSYSQYAKANNKPIGIAANSQQHGRN